MLWAGFVAEQAALAGRVVDFERFEIDDVWQRTGLYADATASAVFLFDLRARADESCTVECGAEVLAALSNPGVGIVQRIHEPEYEAIERLLFGRAKLFDDAYI